MVSHKTVMVNMNIQFIPVFQKELQIVAVVLMFMKQSFLVNTSINKVIDICRTGLSWFSWHMQYTPLLNKTTEKGNFVHEKIKILAIS